MESEKSRIVALDDEWGNEWGNEGKDESPLKKVVIRKSEIREEVKKTVEVEYVDLK